MGTSVFFCLLPASHSATVLYNSCVHVCLRFSFDSCYQPPVYPSPSAPKIQSLHSKEFREDAERPSASCVFFLLVIYKNKNLHKPRHLLESLKRCQMSQSYGMTTTRCLSWCSLQQWLSSSWRASEIKSIYWNMSLLIMKIGCGFKLFGPVFFSVLFCSLDVNFQK